MVHFPPESLNVSEKNKITLVIYQFLLNKVSLMKKLLLILTVGLMGFLSTSCFESSTTVKIKNDGSGTIVSSSYMNTAALGEMGGEADVAPVPTEEELKEMAKSFGDGVTFKSIEEGKNAAGWEGYVATYEFADINNLKLNMNEGMDNMAEGEEAQFITFKMEGKELELNIPFEAKEGEPTEEEKEEAKQGAMGIAMMAPMMKGASWSIDIEVEGEIAESNALHQEGNKIGIITMDMEEMLTTPNLADKMLAMEYFKTREEAIEAMKEIKGIKADYQETIKVKLK